MGIFDAFTKNGRCRLTLTDRSRQAFDRVQAARAALDNLDLLEATRQEAFARDHIEVVMSMVLTLEKVPGRAIDAAKAAAIMRTNSKYAEEWEAVRMWSHVRARVAALEVIQRDCARLVNLVDFDALKQGWDSADAPRPVVIAVRDLYASVVHAFLTLEDLDPGTQSAAAFVLGEMQNRPKYSAECAAMETASLFLMRHGWESIFDIDENGDFIHR